MSGLSSSEATRPEKVSLSPVARGTRHYFIYFLNHEIRYFHQTIFQICFIYQKLFLTTCKCKLIVLVLIVKHILTKTLLKWKEEMPNLNLAFIEGCEVGGLRLVSAGHGGCSPGPGPPLLPPHLRRLCWPLTMHIHCRSCLFYRHSQFLTQKHLRFYTWFRKKSTFTMYNWINFHIRWCKVHIFLHWVSVSREVQFSEFLIKCSPRLVSAQPRDPGDVSKGISNRNGSRASHSSPGCSFPFQ